MPPIKLNHIVSFSTEDKNHPADNLLKDEHYLKWKSSAGEDSSASVVIQFEKATIIDSIDIGNEGSAFIEVLVNRSNCKSDFQVLLVASSFMSPAESKSATNLNRVRMFSSDKLTHTICKEKWDLVKIICTQPFNKSLQYGLSFIKFHSPPESKESSPKLKQQILGAFKLNTDDENETIRPGSFFAQRVKTTPKQLTGAAAVRAASVKAEIDMLQEEKTKQTEKKQTEKATLPKTNKKENENGPDDKNENSKSDVIKRTSTSALKTNPPTLKRTSTFTGSPNNTTTKPETKKETVPPAKREVSFEKIMSKVIFALSGFQNPYRAELREKALEMGAKYRPDWDKTCTHLICAFQNTPKFLQVQREKGKIVSKDWILDCHKQKERISWKTYKMSGPDESEDDGSSEVDTEEIAKPSTSTTSGKNELSSDSTSDDGNQGLNNSEATDTQPLSDSEECDTEDEINRVNGVNQSNHDDSDEAYNADTDVEEDESEDAGGCSPRLPPSSKLPEYFCGLHFFLYGNFSADMRRLLVRYIIAFQGVVEDYMNERVKFVITDEKWSKNFDEALKENSRLVFVKPEWIFSCSDQGNIVSHQSHLVTPTGH